MRLVPTGEALQALEEDYSGMVEDGLLFDDTDSFDALIGRCADIEDRANRARRSG